MRASLVNSTLSEVITRKQFATSDAHWN